MKPRKKKKCNNCKKWFVPVRDFQSNCGYICALEDAKVRRKKNQLKKANKEKKEFYDDDKSTLKQKAQKVINTYIRVRDKNELCISCQKPPKQAQAGHYVAVGKCQNLRYNVLNIHMQCAYCNTFKHGNHLEYRTHLIKKIGLKYVEHLDATAKTSIPAKFSKDYLKRLIKVFKKKTRLLKG